MSQSLGSPRLDMVTDPPRFLAWLIDVYAALRELAGTQLPSKIPALQAITLPTHAALRAQVGDLAGQLGPRACIVTGRTNPLDGGEGVYVWDPTSQALDDDATVIQASSTKTLVGRWRRGAF